MEETQYNLYVLIFAPQASHSNDRDGYLPDSACPFKHPMPNAMDAVSELQYAR